MDPLDPTEFASVVTAITSAFGDRTRRDIYLLVHSTADGLTAGEVAEHFDLHANVARHHLDKLSAGGYLESSTDRPAGGAGRPSRRYRTPAQPVTFNVPVRQDDLLIRLLGSLLDDLGPERSAAIAEDVGRNYGAEMAESLGPDPRRSARSALHAIVDALSAHGFGTHAEVDGDALKLVTDHCPFGDLPAVHPVICALDRGIVMGMMEHLHEATPVRLTTAAEVGSDSCVTLFRSA